MRRECAIDACIKASTSNISIFNHWGSHTTLPGYLYSNNPSFARMCVGVCVSSKGWVCATAHACMWVRMAVHEIGCVFVRMCNCAL